jgi:hypothetical protein
LEKVAARLGTAINNQVKIQRFLDAMHPELRYAVEPEVKDRATAAWKDIKELAIERMMDYSRQDTMDEISQRIEAIDSPFSERPPFPHSSQAMNPQPNQGSPNHGPPTNNKQVRRLTNNEKAQLRCEKKCYYCEKTGHFFNECRARQRIQQSGKWVQSAHTTVSIIEEPIPSTVEEFIEAARAEPTKKDHINNMVTNMNINEHQARALLDTGTTGTNLMSSSWVQTHNINTRELSTAVTIHMAVKGSKTNANRFAHANVEIKQGTTERNKFLIVALSSYDIILEMPFLQDNHVSLNTADSNAYFPKPDVTIQCATRQLRTLATSSVMDPTWPHRAPATAAIRDSTWSDRIPDDSAKQPIRRIPILANPTTMESPHIPLFDKMFPTVFPEKKPEALPPLRNGCNHII